MKEELITFKGVKEGVFINIDSGNYLDIKDELDIKLKNAANFYRGTKLLGIKTENLLDQDIIELKLILKYKYDFIVSNEELPSHILDSPSKEDSLNIGNENESNDSVFEGIESGMTKFVNGTLRSGQVVKYDGNIVIVGDVNPGALIQAKGNIIVLGILRGVAHAGTDGNLKSIIASYYLQPTQLRIGDKITRPPDEDLESYRLPEIAKIKDGEIIIEPYLPNKQ